MAILDEQQIKRKINSEVIYLVDKDQFEDLYKKNLLKNGKELPYSWDSISTLEGKRQVIKLLLQINENTTQEIEKISQEILDKYVKGLSGEALAKFKKTEEIVAKLAEQFASNTS